jgi:hypothetical protein
MADAPEPLGNLIARIPPAVNANPPLTPADSADGKSPEIAANGYAQASEISDCEPENLNPPHPVQQEIVAAMLEVVSQLTGYPTEMLGLDMDIEAELGIDSIKRVEILSTLEEKMPDLPTVSPEIMGSLKTLGQIIEYLSEPNDTGAYLQDAVEQTTERSSIHGADGASDEPTRPQQPAPVLETVEVLRNVVSIREITEAPMPRLTLAADRKVFVTEDNTGLSEQIAEELTRQGISTIRVSLDILKYKKQLPAAAGLIIVQDPGSDSVDQNLKEAFALARYLAPGLIESSEQGDAIFATLTRLDGAFGLKGGTIAQPPQAAWQAWLKQPPLNGQMCAAMPSISHRTGRTIAG